MTSCGQHKVNDGNFDTNACPCLCQCLAAFHRPGVLVVRCFRLWWFFFAFEPPFPFPSYFTLSFIPLPFMTPHTPWVLGPLGRWAALQVLGPRDQGPKLFVVQSMGKQRNKRKMAVSLLHLSKHSLLHGTFGLPWAMAAGCTSQSLNLAGRQGGSHVLRRSTGPERTG